MGDRRHTQLRDLFIGARRRRPSSRLEWLHEQCSDTELVDEVISLLEGERADGFLETPALGDRFALPTVMEAVGELELPRHIAGYAIRSVLGAGGMGIVYLAEQDSPRREVALKVLQPGRRSPEILRRFAHEAEALGRLSHPGIAQVYAAGASGEGAGAQPWIAMELVSGLALTDFADDRDLDLMARLELLAQVCDAVHHAHRRGVVHRDLKPANVLVDGAGRTKVLDFGVARLATEDGERSWQTACGQVLGTLPYMSPEQLSGDPDRVDGRSDVYALGALGYELLVGEPPLDLDGLGLVEAARVVDERQPRRPSTVRPAVRGDVETVLLRALAKDEGQRYPSAAALAADLRRVVNDEPILARRPGTWEQFARYARRNRGLVGAVALAFLLLVAAVVGTTLGREAALDAQAAAEKEAGRAQSVKDFVFDLLRAPRQGPDDVDTSFAGVLKRMAAKASEALAEYPVDRAELAFVLGVTLHSLGEKQEAAAILDESLALFEEHGTPGNPYYLQARNSCVTRWLDREEVERAAAVMPQLLADTRAHLGPLSVERVLIELNQLNLLNAQGCFEEVLSLSEEWLARASRVSRLDEATSLMGRRYRIEALRGLGRSEEHRAALEAAVAEARTACPEDPVLYLLLEDLGVTAGMVKERELALELFDEVLRGRERIYPSYHLDVHRARGNKAAVLGYLGRNEEALPLARMAAAGRSEQLGPRHPRSIHARGQVGRHLLCLERGAEAVECMEPVVRDAREVLPEDGPHRPQFEEDLGRCYALVEDVDRAVEHLDEAYRLLTKHRGPNHASTQRLRRVFLDYLEKVGRSERAEELRAEQ